jgi:hypothetical protein
MRALTLTYRAFGDSKTARGMSRGFSAIHAFVGLIKVLGNRFERGRRNFYVIDRRARSAHVAPVNDTLSGNSSGTDQGLPTGLKHFSRELI